MAVNNKNSLSRKAVADLLNVHPDSVSRLLHEGLASAVLEWGGHSKTMAFSRPLFERWQFLRACPARRRQQHCSVCWHAAEDIQALAEHLLEARHGYGGCELCTVDWPVSQPCTSPTGPYGLRPY